MTATITYAEPDYDTWLADGDETAPTGCVHCKQPVVLGYDGDREWSHLYGDNRDGSKACRASLEVLDTYTITRTGGIVLGGVQHTALDVELHTVTGERIALSLVKANGARRWDVTDLDALHYGYVASDGLYWWGHTPDGERVTRDDYATRAEAVAALIGR